jgi:hypothetical protein
MKIYLAARYSRHSEMREIRDTLMRLGYEVTSRWIDQHGGNLLESIVQAKLNSDPKGSSVYAVKDVEDIARSDLVMSFTSENGGGKGGRHVEFGLSIGLGKRVVLIGPRENVFHCLPIVEHYQTLGDFLEENLFKLR